MHIREKKWILAISILGFLFLAGVSLWKFEDHGMQYEVLTESKWEKLKEKLVESDTLTFNLTFNGENLPFDAAAKTFYLPLAMEEEWERGTFSGVSGETEISVFFLEDFSEGDKLSMIQKNDSVPFVACMGDNYSVYHLKITGVPIVTFSSTEQVKDGLSVFAFSLYDYADKEDWTIHCYTTSSLHGNTSLAYDKKSLRLKLLEQEDGVFKKHNASLLQMREDDDWILNGLYADESRIRDKLCIDLWNDTGADSNPYGKSFGTDAEYVEVFINDSYQGLYLLMYPIDRKQIGTEAVSDQIAAGETQIERIYKKKYTALWQESDFMGEMPDPNMPDYRGGFYVKGDTVLGDLSEWEPLRALASCITGSDEKFADEITTIADQNNVVENWLFYQAIAGFDNQAKNYYYAVRRQGDGLKGYFIPWDLNISFGVVYADNPYYCEEDSSTVNQPVLWEPGQRLVQLDVGGSAGLAKKTWEKWRAGAFSDEALQERIASLEAFVKDSGAFKREKERWQEGNCKDDFSLVYAYAGKRMEFVDRYVEALGETE